MSRSHMHDPNYDDSDLVDLDFPEDLDDHPLARATDAAISRALTSQLQNIPLSRSGVDAATVARSANRRARFRRWRLAGSAMALTAGAAACIVAVSLGQGLLPSSNRPGGEGSVNATQAQTVAPWGASSGQSLTAHPVSAELFFLSRPPATGATVAPQALVYGKLSILTGGCLGIEPATAIVWPPGTTPLEDGAGVRLANGETYRVGDVIRGSGGYANVAFSGMAADCPGSDVAILNAPPVE